MKGKFQTLILWLVALICAGGALLIFEHEQLWKVQEMNLWLDSCQFLREKMVVPGGLLSWVGSWFTQFFYYPWLGVLLLCGWWLLLMWLTKRTFRIPDRWTVVTLLPVALLLVSIVDLGYWIYLMKLQGYSFVATIGSTAVVALVWAYRSLPEKAFLRAAFIIVCGVAGYPLLGIYGLFAALLMGLSRKSFSLINCLLSIITVIAVPLLFYRFVYYETSMARIYIASLPIFTVTENHLAYYIPFCLLALFYLALTLFSKKVQEVQEVQEVQKVQGVQGVQEVQGVQGVQKGQKSSKGRSGKGRAQGAHSPSSIAHSPLSIVHSPLSIVHSPLSIVHSPLSIVSLLFFIAIAVGVYFSWFKDENFHHELVMEHAIDRLDWQTVLDEAAMQKDEPTRSIVVMRNIALARLGRQGDEMYQYRNGSKEISAPFPMRLLMVTGPLVYYHYGMPNCCSRVSMEMGVEFGWNVEYFKYMARCAVLNGEKQLARKYLGILRQTLFYDSWVDEIGKLVGKEELVQNDPEMAFITHMMCYDNRLTSDNGYVESFVMNRLAESKKTDDPIFLEQTLLASLWARDLDLFWKRLGVYAKQHPNKQLPVHYQEAALLYLSLKGQNTAEWPFDTSVRESYRMFNELMPSYNHEDIRAVREAIYPLFGRTFYYEYYLMNNLPQY